MRTIHCPKDIGFVNTFDGEDCKQEQFYNDCYHCWASAVDNKRSKGKWIKATGMMPPEFHGHHFCLECGNFANMKPPFGNHEDLSKYCPNCGADMWGDKE